MKRLDVSYPSRSIDPEPKLYRNNIKCWFVDNEDSLLCKQCFVCERDEGFNGSYNTSINLLFKGLCSYLLGQLGLSCDNYSALIQRQ